MNELRLRCITLAAWISLLHYADRFGDSVALMPFTGAVAGILALAVVLVRRLNELRLAWLLVLPVPVLLVLKLLLNHATGIQTTPATLIEPCVLGITMVLAHGAGRSLQEFRGSLVSTLFRNTAAKPPSSFETGQAEIYREICRARTHHRPLTLMTVRPEDHAGKVPVDRFAKQVADQIARNYMTARLGELLTDQTSDSDVIVEHDDHFLLLLPEAGRDKANHVAHQLKAAAKQHLDLDLQLGLSVFPDDEITFLGLLERAESGGNGHAARDPVGATSGDAPERGARESKSQ